MYLNILKNPMWIKLFFFFVTLFVQHELPDVDIMEPNYLNDGINMHIMLASHTDAGWIYTFDEYYRGTGTAAGGCVSCLLFNVISSLPKNPQRKYDMSEIAFLKRWWVDMTPSQRTTMTDLVKKKQFGFMNGAWVANDEATAYYEDIMDNFILGHRWLKDNLDVDTSVGWQVDSFGNSATQAALMAQAGFEGHFFSRADYVDRETRRVKQSLQFNWQPENPHKESVFTQMMYVAYSDTKFMVADNFYCRSIFCHGRLKDFSKVTDYIKKQAASFKTNNVLFMVCDDFLFTATAETDYDGVEDLIRYYNERPELGIRPRFSHLTDYLAQVKQDFMLSGSTASIPVRQEDTFPYIEKPGHVWTGYFTSKPMFKLMVREYSEYYNAAKLLLTKLLLGNNKDALENQQEHSQIDLALNSLEEPLAIVQHHDAVSGTNKEYVRRDYENRLKSGRQTVETALQPVMTRYLKNRINEDVDPIKFYYDWFFRGEWYNNVFDATKTTTFVVFNPGSERKMLVKVKVLTDDYTIIDEENNQIDTDTICNNKECFMYLISDLDAYSANVYKLVKTGTSNKLEPTNINSQGAEAKIGDNFVLKVNGDLTNFDYKFCTDASHCTSDSYSLNYLYYEASDMGRDRAPSGAYVFSPYPQSKKEYSKLVSGKILQGKVVTLVQIFREDLRTDLTIIHGQPEKGVEIDTYLDPIKHLGNGREIVLLVKSAAIKNGGTFYTDANGYYMQRRQKDHKETYTVAKQEGVNMNYYPMTSSVYIEDTSSTQRLSIVTDRAQGVTSLDAGEIEIMIHRVTIKDDWKGVGEALQERDSSGSFINVTTRHYLSYSQSSVGIEDQRRQQQYDLDRGVQLWFYTSNNEKFAETSNIAQNQLVLPNLVKLYVRSYKMNEYIVRLHNLDEVHSKDVEIYDSGTKSCTLLNDFAGINGLKVKSVTELSWMTTKKKSELSKNVLDPKMPDLTDEDGPDYSMARLLPMEIRTFSVVLEA